MEERDFIIAIKKNDPEYWFEVVDQFPVEEEILGDFLLVNVRAFDLPTAVRLAKIHRAIFLMKEVLT